MGKNMNDKRIIIFCNGDKEVDDFLTHCQYNTDIKWNSGEEPLQYRPMKYEDFIYFDICGNKMLYGETNDCTHVADVFASNGYEVLSLQEFISIVPMPTEHDLIDFLNG